MGAGETTRVPPASNPKSLGQPGAGDLTGELIAADVWTDEQVAAAGIPVVDVPFVTVGGGIGSFVTFDYLRIAGVPRHSIKVLGNNDTPWSTYEYLTRNSQIPRHERLRSHGRLPERWAEQGSIQVDTHQELTRTPVR